MKNAPAELYNPPMKYRVRLKTRILEALKGTSETTAATAYALVRGLFTSRPKERTHEGGWTVEAVANLAI